MADPVQHEINHHRYTLFAVSAEYIMAFSLHFLPTLHMAKVAIGLGMLTFAVYSLVSALYFRQSLAYVRCQKGNRLFEME